MKIDDNSMQAATKHKQETETEKKNEQKRSQIECEYYHAEMQFPVCG